MAIVLKENLDLLPIIRFRFTDGQTKEVTLHNRRGAPVENATMCHYCKTHKPMAVSIGMKLMCSMECAQRYHFHKLSKMEKKWRYKKADILAYSQKRERTNKWVPKVFRDLKKGCYVCGFMPGVKTCGCKKKVCVQHLRDGKCAECNLTKCPLCNHEQTKSYLARHGCIKRCTK
jgi:hypothetical protein